MPAAVRMGCGWSRSEVEARWAYRVGSTQAEEQLSMMASIDASGCPM